jgi:RHS repeat-associated protein
MIHLKNTTPSHPAFGSVMEGRSFVGDTSSWYRFGFGGQEKDDEIYGKGKTYSAEFWEYDARVGRRWNVDPVERPHLSPFAAFSNNPIVFIDPEGNTDYYNNSGKWIGTDGITNGVNAIVTSYKIEKSIKRTSRRGKEYKAELPNGSFNKLSTIEVLVAIVIAFDEQGKPYGEDQRGGLHEVAVYFDATGCQSPYLHGEDVLTVEKAQHAQGEDITIYGPAPPEGFEEGKVSIHSHLTETVKYFNILMNEETVYGPSASEPSEGYDTESFKNYDLNVIVGKEGKAELERVDDLTANTVRPKLQVKYRPDKAFFFDRNSKPLFNAGIGSLRSIVDGTGKKDSRIYRKYEKRK